MQLVKKNPDARRRFIFDRATDVGHIGISDLAGQMNVSMETVRRDLAVMESNGLIRRTYGGAYPVRQASHKLLLSMGAAHPEVARIAAAGAEILVGARSVYLDGGDAVHALAALITARRVADPASCAQTLTVHTRSLTAASSLVTAPNVNVVVLGGRVRADTLATVVSAPPEDLSGVDIDFAVMAASAVSVEGGVTTDEADTCLVKSHLMTLAQQRVLLAPQSACGRTAAHRFADVGDFDLLITGSSMLAHEAKEYTALGPRVIRV